MPNYIKQTWNNDVGGATKLNATRLQHIEDGIEAVDAAKPDTSGLTEIIQDAIGSFFADQANLDFTYNDAGNTLTIAVTGLTAGSISGLTEAIQDAVGAFLVDQTNFDFTYNDAGDAIGIAITGLLSTDIGNFTEAVQDAIGAFFGDQTNLDFTYNDAGNALTIAVTGLVAASIGDFTEAVQDAIGAFFADQTNLDFTYNDAGNALTIAVTGLSSTSISDFTEAVQDVVGAFFVDQTNIDFTYNDAGNLIGMAITGLAPSDITGLTEYIQDAIGGQSGIGGAGLTWTYDDTGNSLGLVVNVDGVGIEISGDALQLKDGGITSAKFNSASVTEYIQDVIGAFFTDQTNIDFTYNDAGNAIGIVITGLVSSDISGLTEAIQDAIGGLTGFGGSGLTFTYDDSGNAVTLAVNVDGTTLEISGDALRVKDQGIAASKIAVTPVGLITDTNVQAALASLDTRLSSGSTFIDRLKSGLTLRDDFMGGGTPASPGTVNTELTWQVPTGAVTAPLLGVTNTTPGNVSLSVSAVAAFCCIFLGLTGTTNSLELAPLFVYEARVQLSALNDGTNQYSTWIGLHSDIAGAEPLNGFYFRYTNADGANWQSILANNGTRTVNNTGIAPAAATWYRLRIVCDGAGNTYFYVDDVLCNVGGTPGPVVGGNVPTGTNRYVPSFSIVKTASSTARSLRVDYFGLYYEHAR